VESAVPRYCTACGALLPGPAPRCPRCGAAILAPAGRGGGTVVRVAVALVTAGVLALGLAAAITVPGYLRFQVRSRSALVRMQLGELVQAEVRAAQEGGAFAVFEPFPAGPLGAARRPFSPADQALARRLGWETPASHGRFSVAVARDPSGVEAASFCAESDVDGDGVRAVHVAFVPALEDGEVVLRPPPAPCTEAVPYSDAYAPGRVERISKEDVY
jgi:hypothetical protein